jgi:predicted ATPase/DNA-binding XRE family transcriptional regulator
MAVTGVSAFGTLLRQLRLAAGLTQESLAERAGVSAKAVSELERDPTRLPRLETVALLAEALGLDRDERAGLLATARPTSSPSHALRRAEGVASTLPRPLTPLFGRAGVVDAIAELIRRGGAPEELRESARWLTLTGPGGVGKTRLAIAAAERAAEDFADGVLFVDLAPLRDPSLVLPAIAQRLTIDERDKIPLDERLTAALRRKRLLLVLDNLEHLLPGAAHVVTLLETCPRLVILATSRVALRVRSEREYRVAPLELPDESAGPAELARSPAAALFLDRARAAGADLEPTALTTPAVAQICRRLDGLPLAVELAAAWSRLLPPPALLERLERRLPLLVGGPHDLPARQRTMRDAIAWSYDLLEARQQRLFRRLCVFSGGCTPEAAEAVCGEADEASAVLVGLAELVDRSLLRSAGEDGRLTILETLREFGLERLEEGETEDAQRRHATYFLALAKTAARGLGGPDGVEWGVRLEQEHDNLRAALSWAVEREEAGFALRLSGALARFWWERGHLSEGRRWLQAALELPADGATNESAARTTALVGAARLALEQGMPVEAATFGAEAVALARQEDDPALLVSALNVTGMVASQRGEYELAARHHEEALAVARESGDRAGVAAALSGLEPASSRTGDMAGGTVLLERALAEYRVLGDVRGVAGTLKNLTLQAMFAGEFARATALGEETLGLVRTLGDTGSIAEALWILGVIAQSQGMNDGAELLHEEGLAIRRKRGDERSAAQSLDALGAIALAREDFPRARELLSEALATLSQRGDRWAQAINLTLLGHVALAEGDPSQALTHLAESATLFQSIGNPLYLPWCLEGLAGVAAARGHWERAGRLCGARDALCAALGSGLPPAHPTAYARVLADSRAALGDGAFAAAHEAGQAPSPEQALAEARELATDDACN